MKTDRQQSAYQVHIVWLTRALSLVSIHPSIEKTMPALIRSLLLFATMLTVTHHHVMVEAAFLSMANRSFIAPTATLLFGKRDTGKVKKDRVQKSNLPEKICVVCERPYFAWRKKWERCWDDVTCCSKACNATRKAAKTIRDQILLQQGPTGRLPSALIRS